MQIKRQDYKNGNIKLIIDGMATGSLTMNDADKPAAYIKEIYIKPRHQNKGYGQSLLNKAISLLRDNESVSLYVNVDNCGAIRFYRRNGFIISLQTTKRPQHYLMTKILK